MGMLKYRFNQLLRSRIETPRGFDRVVKHQRKMVLSAVVECKPTYSYVGKLPMLKQRFGVPLLSPVGGLDALVITIQANEPTKSEKELELFER